MSLVPIFHGAARYLAARAHDERSMEVRARVEGIVARVEKERDRALIELAFELDGVTLRPPDLCLAPDRIRTLAARAGEKERSVLERAARNIRAFHERQREESWSFEFADSSLLGQKITPIDAVGVYVPGGRAVYPSTVLMNAIPAQIAGVRRIVLATPPGAVERSPALAAALVEIGLTEVYQVGGAQAIAALAFGTETVPRVDKIVGPGNLYVATAKKLLYGIVGIDSPAGPSEILVLADGSASPRLVAADLLSQAEHGSGDEKSLLVTTSPSLAERVRAELAIQLEDLPTRETIAAVLEKHGALVVVADLDEAIALVDRLAPEHLEIHAERADEIAREVRNAGAIFLGDQSPVPVGDFYAGPNHVLPTGGAARFASPLGVYDFVKRSNLIRYSRERLAREREDIELFARMEGFPAHARAISVRFEP